SVLICALSSETESAFRGLVSRSSKLDWLISSIRKALVRSSLRNGPWPRHSDVHTSVIPGRWHNHRVKVYGLRFYYGVRLGSKVIRLLSSGEQAMVLAQSERVARSGQRGLKNRS